MNFPVPLPEITYHYFPDKKNEYELVDIEVIYKKSFKDHDPFEPHRVKFYLLIFFNEGSGRHSIDFVDYAYEAGTFMHVYPGQVHAWDASDRPKGKIFVYSERFVDHICANVNLAFNNKLVAIKNKSDPVIKPNLSALNQLTKIIETIEFVQNKINANLSIAMHLYLAFSLLLESLQTDTFSLRLSPKQRVLFSNFVLLMENNFKTKREVSWYASQLCISYKSLNEICKKSLNQTAKQIIDEYVVTEVKRKLAVASVPIQTLCYEFGFEDLSNFNKYFKKVVGITPKQFKNQFNVGHIVR